MSRCAFTIILNGKHHLEHNDFIGKMPKLFDYWCIVEGASLPGGSTAWCKNAPTYHRNGASIDGTRDLLLNIGDMHDNVSVIFADNPWPSKDAMVNAALDKIRYELGTAEEHCLWQVDVDEQWEEDDLTAAEEMLYDNGAKTGCFHADYYVGSNLLAVGYWGEGCDPDNPIKNAYRRLWAWDGERFATHEPPMLDGGNGKEILLPQRFQHYAYWDERDVAFKEQYYSYTGLVDAWKSLQSEKRFPQPISRLPIGWWANTQTQIVRV